MLIRSRAPLRLGLAGGGTDVSPYCDQFGGAVLNATVDFYAYTTLEPIDTGIEFVSVDLGASAAYPLQPEIAFDGNLDLFKAVYNHVVRRFNGGRPFGVRISTRVDVPAGSGLGSSSTLVVSMVAAYAEYLNVALSDYELASTAWVIERREAHLQGGKQDQYAAAFGGFNFIEFGANEHVLVNPLRVKEWLVSELEASLLLFFTGKSRSSAAIIDEQVKNVRESNEGALRATHHIKEEANRMKECLLRGNLTQMHEVLRGSWESKKRMAQNISNPHIDSLYEKALEEGAHCAKISGAGGGGFMMLLIDPTRKDKVRRKLEETAPDGIAYSAHFTNQGAQVWRMQ